MQQHGLTHGVRGGYQRLLVGIGGGIEPTRTAM